MKFNGKAQVEMQFNWIFVLIVGVIILSFFVVIAMRQKGASEQQVNIGFFTNFETAVSGVSAVEGKTLLFEIPSMDLRYDCTLGCDCAAYAGLSRAKAQSSMFRFAERIIFSPNRIKGNNLLTWSKDWSYPYKITNFLLMTSPEVKYLIEDTPLGNQLFKDLPPSSIDVEQAPTKAFDKQFFTPNTEIKNITGNYKVKFVFTDTDPTDPAKFTIPSQLYDLPNSDVTAIKIEKAEADSHEMIVFYEKNDNNLFEERGKSYLFGEATRFAAIFAEDMNAYSCMMNKAFKAFNTVSKVYNEKLNIYFDEIFSGTPCTSIDDCGVREFCTAELKCQHQCAIHYIDTYISQLARDTGNFDFSKLQHLTAISISSNAKSVSQQNENAIKDSCPHIY